MVPNAKHASQVKLTDPRFVTPAFIPPNNLISGELDDTVHGQLSVPREFCRNKQPTVIISSRLFQLIQARTPSPPTKSFPTKSP